MPESSTTLENLNFDNSYTRLPQHFYQRIQPTPLEGAYLISINEATARQLDLEPSNLDADALAQYFGGHQPLPGSDSIAMKYTGHQFGVYNPDLGDGRGLLLGEVVNRAGERWDLHLKGSGRTAYSRFGDGRAVLRSSIREYLAGEAMIGLGIPTTRGLCLVGSKEEAFRERPEPCAALLRISHCHIRFGHFEHFFYKGQYDDLKLLADYCIDRYYPQCKADDNPYLSMFTEVLERSAQLVASWQAYGFVHGVLNTDNMSILGETFDYGPYTFKDRYQPNFVANGNDHQGRYAFERQPDIVLWNLSCLAQALLPLISQEPLVEQLNHFAGRYHHYYLNKMRQRLGLQLEQESDAELVNDLLQLMTRHQVDMTRLFRSLCEFENTETSRQALMQFFDDSPDFESWLDRYRTRLGPEPASTPIRRLQMRSVNPKYVLRNYMAQEAIQAAEQGDFEPVNQMLALLRQPFDEHPDWARYAGEVPQWAGFISLTCSS